MQHDEIVADWLPSPTPEHFHLAEFQAIHAEVNVKINNIEANARFLFIGVGALWAWLLANDLVENHGRSLLIFVPVLFSALFSFVIVRQMKFVEIQGAYLSLLEERLGRGELGWQGFLGENGKSSAWSIHKITIVAMVAVQVGIIIWARWAGVVDAFPQIRSAFLKCLS